MIMKTVAITGGIGSGKSVVSRLLRVEGYPVYDCDSQAKRIMDNDAEIQRQLQNAFGEDVVVDGVIHRQKLASLVFGNSENLRKLNAIVHPAVIADIKKWSVAEQKDLVFVETAILRESGMETLVDEVWVVDAPKDIRVARVMVRNNMPEEDVRKRIDSQNDNPKFSVPTSVVENYGSNSVIVQVQNLLKTMFNKPGLFKLVSQGKNMLIVESLTTKKRTPAYSHDKIVSLGDIAIYTDEEEVPLSQVFQTVYDKEGKKLEVADYKTDASLEKFFAEILPNYDRERVYNTDIKKVISWYNSLIDAGYTEFYKPENKEEEPKEEK